MFNRMFRTGLVAFVAGMIWPVGTAIGQVPVDTTPASPYDSTPPSAVPLPSDPQPATPRATSGLPGSAKRLLRDKPQKVTDGDVWKKHPPIWSIHDPSPYTHPYATQIYIAPGVGAYPGGPAGQFGSPYYYTANAQYMGAGIGPVGGVGPVSAGAVGFAPGGFGGGAGLGGPPVIGGGYAGGGFGGPGPLGYGPGPGLGGGPGGPQVAALPGMLPGNPYLYHFGPGFYRYQEAGHYRFPYYSYRRPWYYPGHPSYNRDTNIPW
ncbi:MAG: hypothetical protein JWM11_3115 [Planctomycetaceae bacterium]|nr:hypothetical protein [Planctomycetaceae bacterium]